MDSGNTGDRRADEIAASLVRVRGRLRSACDDAGRDPDSVTLLAVTKFFPAEDAAVLRGLGCRELAESREQEAREKIPRVEELVGPEAAHDTRWHMVGTVQRKKARAVARWAYAVHSVDSARLLDALDSAAAAARDAGERTAPLEVYLQLSLDGDPGRGGAAVSDLDAIADRAEHAVGLRLAGLMAVPPRDWEAERAFAELAASHARLLRNHPQAGGLSAGMSGDMEAAVRHGSTCVRVGTALLGGRPIISR